MDSIHLTDRSHPYITPEQARDVRARVWSYIFYCYERHKAAEASDSEDGGEGGSKNGSPTGR
jgi:hypothetical protein